MLLERVTAAQDADFYSPGWAHDGRILSIAQRFNAGLWRFRRVESRQGRVSVWNECFVQDPLRTW